MKIIYLLIVLLVSHFTYCQNESIPSLTKLQGLWKYSYNAESGIDSTVEMYKLIRNDTMVFILNDISYSKPIVQFSIIGFEGMEGKQKKRTELKTSGNKFCSINFPVDIDSLGNIKRLSSTSWMTMNENEKEEFEPDYINLYIKSIPETYIHIDKLPQELINKLKKTKQLNQISKFL